MSTGFEGLAILVFLVVGIPVAMLLAAALGAVLGGRRVSGIAALGVLAFGICLLLVARPGGIGSSSALRELEAVAKSHEPPKLLAFKRAPATVIISNLSRLHCLHPPFPPILVAELLAETEFDVVVLGCTGDIQRATFIRATTCEDESELRFAVRLAKAGFLDRCLKLQPLERLPDGALLVIADELPGLPRQVRPPWTLGVYEVENGERRKLGVIAFGHVSKWAGSINPTMTSVAVNADIRSYPQAANIALATTLDGSIAPPPNCDPERVTQSVATLVQDRSSDLQRYARDTLGAKPCTGIPQ